LSLIKYLRNQDFINSKLINRSKNKIIEAISLAINKQCEEEIIIIFKEYLVQNIFTESDAEIYFKCYNLEDEKQSNKDFL
jgi:hypothetical protein